MKRYFNVAGIFGAVLLTAYLSIPAPVRQIDEYQYFPETGHTVREPFIDFFNQTGGVGQHGFPITDDYVDLQTGLLVQYFQNSRLEWHPGNPAPYKVQLGLLADELQKREPPIPVTQIPPANDPNCQYFNETGHSICFKFREYWHKHGGLDRFGYPITEWIIDGDRMVQYFQRARMEWHPEKEAGQRIQLAPLGEAYYHAAGLDLARLKPNPLSASPGEVRSIKARGSVVNSVAMSDSQQTTYVFVTDQFGEPIGGAAVTLVFHYPEGDEAYTLPPTSASGTSLLTFTVPPLPAGTIVSMDFIIGYAGVFSETRTSYMVWF